MAQSAIVALISAEYITAYYLKHNQRCSLRARLRDSPVLGQIREALMYGEQYYGNNSINLSLMVKMT